MAAPETHNSDLYLMELAARNPSLGGRALVQEILERGPLLEDMEAPNARDSHEAFRSQAIDHPDYRTPVEQANWLHEQSPMLRALYEQGAELKGNILVIPAEEHELSEDRETPFITSLDYALKQIESREQAQEFHALAHAISGETADARTQITVFKTYYDRLKNDERGSSSRQENRSTRAQVVARILGKMRILATEMARLETRESVETVSAEDVRAECQERVRWNTAARRINVHDESLRLPAGLRYEQKERLISQTLPEIDRRLEMGIKQSDLFYAIDKSMLRPDPQMYFRELAGLTNNPADEQPARPVSREEYLESQRTLLRLCEQDAKHLRAEKAMQRENEWEPHAVARHDQIDFLARRLRHELGQNILDEPPERAAASRLFVSLSHHEAGAFRLPVTSVKVYETMAKIAAGAQLSLQTWADRNGPEIRLELTEREREERSRIGAFLKHYVEARLRDPETRALNRSPIFREARTAMLNTTTLEDLGRTAAEILRVNERRSETFRRHPIAPELNPPPVAQPLTTWERNLLFHGRAPDHHTAEMRELRLQYGLSRQARAVRVADLQAQRIAPSTSLQILLQELQQRTTPKAIAHFQASILHEKVSQESRVNVHLLAQRIPPHERTFLYELSEERKRVLLQTRSMAGAATDKNQVPVSAMNLSSAGTIHKDSPTLRAYLASMGQIERQLLHEALSVRGVAMIGSEAAENRLTITAARALLPDSQQREIRVRARTLAWQSLVPEESLSHKPLPAAVRISDTIAYLQEELQEKASLAQRVRDDFLATRLQGAEKHRSTFSPDPTFRQTPTSRQQFEQAMVSSFSPLDESRWQELEHFAAQRRAEVYRAFDFLDAQFQEFAKLRTPGNSPNYETNLSLRMEEINVKQSLLQLPPRPLDRFPSSGARVKQEEGESFSISDQLGTEYWGRIASEQAWHLDNLQEILKPEANSWPHNSLEHKREFPSHRSTEATPER